MSIIIFETFDLQFSGLDDRAMLQENIGNLVAGPGEGGRAMNVRAIARRVHAAGGRVLAREREHHVIPQVNRPANQPAAVAPEMVLANIGRGDRGQQQFTDDPMYQMLLSLQQNPQQPQQAAAADAQNMSLAVFNLAQARRIEIDTQMKQFEFAKKHLPEGVEKDERLESIRMQIFACPEPHCCICGMAIAGTSLDISRLACCGTQMHTSCLVQVHTNQCPQCRRPLH